MPTLNDKQQHHSHSHSACLIDDTAAASATASSTSSSLELPMSTSNASLASGCHVVRFDEDEFVNELSAARTQTTDTTEAHALSHFNANMQSTLTQSFTNFQTQIQSQSHSKSHSECSLNFNALDSISLSFSPFSSSAAWSLQHLNKSQVLSVLSSHHASDDVLQCAAVNTISTPSNDFNPFLPQGVSTQPFSIQSTRQNSNSHNRNRNHTHTSNTSRSQHNYNSPYSNSSSSTQTQSPQLSTLTLTPLTPLTPTQQTPFNPLTNNNNTNLITPANLNLAMTASQSLFENCLSEANSLSIPPFHSLTPLNIPRSVSTHCEFPVLSDRYVILSTLQASLFGSVRLAFDIVLHCLVAVKISDMELSSRQTCTAGVTVFESVRREAALLKLMKHNNRFHSNQQHFPQGQQFIAQFIDERQDERFHYLITEFASDGDLYSLLCQQIQHRFQETQAKYFFKQLVIAVAHLHYDHHIAHLDISCENAAVTRTAAKFVIQLLDFGLAALHPAAELDLLNTESTVSLTHPYARLSMPLSSSEFHCAALPLSLPALGKQQYMSLEQFAHLPTNSYLSDCFSLGVVLYQMLTGAAPYENPSLTEDPAFRNICSSQWLSPQQLQRSEAQIYSHLSYEALHLIDSLLKPESHRASIQQILQHPFCQ